MTRVTTERLLEMRMLSHRLIGAPHADAVSAVRSQLATQAQLLAGACWSVAQRTADFHGHHATEAELRRSLAEGRIVQTWPMRGTLHLVAAEDVRWLLALLPPRIHGGALATVWRREGLERADFERARELATGLLEGGRTASRKRLLQHLTSRGVDATGARGSHLIRFLAETATLVIGPADGSTQTFALLDDRVPPSAPLDREEALARLAARYVAGHGPVTDRDLAWWSGLTLTDSRAAFALAAPGLASVEEAGIRYWMDPRVLDPPAESAAASPIDALPAPAAATRAHLLGAFDEYQLGYAGRDLIVDDQGFALVAPNKNGVFKPMVLLGGRVVGAWSARASKSVEVTLTAFPGVAPRRLARLVRPAAERYACYLGATEAVVSAS